MASASQLAAIPLFESLRSSELDELAQWFDVQIAGEDVRLIGEGSSGRHRISAAAAGPP